MCSPESLPKEFEKATEVLPFTKYGLSSINEFRKVEEDINNLEWLKKVGLSNEEIKLYNENESGCTSLREKMEYGVLQSKLDTIYRKIKEFKDKTLVSEQCEQSLTTSRNTSYNILDKIQKNPVKFYPEGHPMNEIKKLEENLFGHLKNDIIPINKRRKILRRFERKKERILSEGKEVNIPVVDIPTVSRPGSLWDLKEIPVKTRPQHADRKKDHIIGPKKQTMYTIKDSKIVRLEPLKGENNTNEFQAVDIVMPMNEAEKQLLEGTKMSLDDIKKIERFKDYEPGSPSKVLYLKNIAPSVSQDRLSLLFNQFVLENGGPIDIRLMTGRMRGQAFIAFQNEHLAIQALEEINGTVLRGRPIIAQFGRNSNRIQIDDIG